MLCVVGSRVRRVADAKAVNVSQGECIGQDLSQVRELEYLLDEAGLGAQRVVETIDTYPHSREARAPFERLAARERRAFDHNQTIFAVAGPSVPRLATGGGRRPLTDRLLPFWRKRIAIKLPDADTLARPGCDGAPQ